MKESIISYFESDHWQSVMDTLRRGDEVRHAHVYNVGSIHPESLQEVMAAYFLAHGAPLERKIGLLAHGRGRANVYYIKPRGMCHFEMFLNFDEGASTIEPLHDSIFGSATRLEYWDDSYMDRFYSNFRFRKMDDEGRAVVRRYFESPDWEAIYGVMAYNNERNVHSHCIAETALHPEEILPIGREVIEAKGWKVGRAVSVVFNLNGMDQGKITYLLSKPEIVLELEWEHRPDVVFRPSVTPLARITTTDMVRQDLQGLPYQRLSLSDLHHLHRVWRGRTGAQS